MFRKFQLNFLSPFWFFFRSLSRLFDLNRDLVIKNVRLRPIMHTSFSFNGKKKDSFFYEAITSLSNQLIFLN